ncbi:MAG: MarR family transcriptional regulator [Chthoniobacter sp.]|nr:MarR family transcriptional regulator [Chthoniobacter sp.]
MPESSEDPKTRANAGRLAQIFTVLQRSFALNLSKELAPGHVSFSQYCLLSFLREQSLGMTDIAQRMGHSTAATTGMVDRLEKLGHVSRATGQTDRRKIFVTITSSGAALVGKVHDDMISNLLKMMDVLDPDEQKAWLQIYEKIFTYCHAQ